MPGVFVDTSAWFALYVPDDEDHARAVQWFEANDIPLVTSDYVIDEHFRQFGTVTVLP